MPHSTVSAPKQLQKLILASASPRRLDLLKQVHIIPDKIMPSDIDETPHRNELPADYVLRMAYEKTDHAFRNLDQKMAGTHILAGDTVVAVGRRILPKAETRQQAHDCLHVLSGRRHRVFGSIVLQLPDGCRRHRLVQSYVRFRQLSEWDLVKYIETGEWQGKAGGYAIQGYAACFIRSISGSYSNIVGFSVYDIWAMLNAAGWYRRSN